MMIVKASLLGGVYPLKQLPTSYFWLPCLNSRYLRRYPTSLILLFLDHIGSIPRKMKILFPQPGAIYDSEKNCSIFHIREEIG